MGADMILEYIEVPHGKHINEIRAELLERIDQLTDEDSDFIDHYFDDILNSVTPLENPDDDDGNGKTDMGEVKRTLGKIVDECLDGLLGGLRDITSIDHKGYELYITGGMSYGDEPTNSYSMFFKYNVLIDSLPENKRVTKW